MLTFLQLFAEMVQSFFNDSGPKSSPVTYGDFRAGQVEKCHLAQNIDVK